MSHNRKDDYDMGYDTGYNAGVLAATNIILEHERKYLDNFDKICALCDCFADAISLIKDRTPELEEVK